MKVQELIPTEQYDTEKMGSLRLMVGDFVSAMTNDNITMAAMKEYFTHSSGAKAISKTGFSSATKYSSATFEDKTYVLERRNLYFWMITSNIRKKSQSLHLQVPVFLYLVLMQRRLMEKH